MAKALDLTSTSRTPLRGFTLAELLISLAILGVIATFTIPKLLTAGLNSQYNARAKEAASMVSAAYQQYQVSGPVSSSFGIQDLTPYMNYVSFKTTGTVDSYVGFPVSNCSISKCLVLHNGAVLRYDLQGTMGGSSSTNAVFFDIDPDGISNGSGGIQFWLYYGGQIRNYGNLSPATVQTYGGSTFVKYPTPAFDPPWFSWQ